MACNVLRRHTQRRVNLPRPHVLRRPLSLRPQHGLRITTAPRPAAIPRVAGALSMTLRRPLVRVGGVPGCCGDSILSCGDPMSCGGTLRRERDSMRCAWSRGDLKMLPTHLPEPSTTRGGGSPEFATSGYTSGSAVADATRGLSSGCRGAAARSGTGAVPKLAVCFAERPAPRAARATRLACAKAAALAAQRRRHLCSPSRGDATTLACAAERVVAHAPSWSNFGMRRPTGSAKTWPIVVSGHPPRLLKCSGGRGVARW